MLHWALAQGGCSLLRNKMRDFDHIDSNEKLNREAGRLFNAQVIESMIANPHWMNEIELIIPGWLKQVEDEPRYKDFTPDQQRIIARNFACKDVFLTDLRRQLAIGIFPYFLKRQGASLK